ncbi:MAG TPA: folate-binding protein [Alphaproteobacteria bacterium]|nr:folate-binding protein [Alphaproteobacteria bacterium]
MLSLSGDDRITFLQGLTTNDVRKVSPERAIYSALLTPQGKYLHDFFVAADGEALLIDCEAARRDDLLRRLKVYRLRSKVALDDLEGRTVVAAAFGDGVLEAFGLDRAPGSARPFGNGGLAFVDPRLAELGVRLMLPAEGAIEALRSAGLDPAGPHDYEMLRLSLGVPDGSRDLMVEKSTLMESNFDELHGIAWDKGCYMGQELTARTKYRGLVKKRLVMMTADAPLPDPGTPVLRNGKEVGELRSGHGNRAIALIRLDALEADGGLVAGTVPVRPEKPSYVEF